MYDDKRIITNDWSIYDTMYRIFNNPNINKEEMKSEYNRAYKIFIHELIYRASQEYEEIRMRSKRRGMEKV